MSTWINFGEIREKVSLEMVIRDYAKVTNLRQDGHRLIGPCPIHRGDSPRAFHADLAKNVWYCFTRCHKGGNQLDFVAALENISIREAALRLQAFFLASPETDRSTPQVPRTTETGERGQRPRRPNPASPRPARPPRTTSSPRSPTSAPTTRSKEKEKKAMNQSTTSTPTEPPTKNPPLNLKLELDPSHPHLTVERRLTRETIETFGVGYCKRGVMKGTIAIPIQDENGVLVAYAGRRLKSDDIEKHGKYVLPKGFRKDLVLYGYDRVKELIPTEGLILVEGCFAVLALYDMGLRNVVASMGSDLSHAQAALLATSPEVIVLYDGDEAGRAGGKKVAELLRGKTRVRVIELPPDAKPDTLSPRAIRWVVNGARALDLERIEFGFAPTKDK